ncbi:hypothetical protein A4G26_17475 [Mycobacterium kansasii]|uniref:Uncharacterized protein n=1 Tax=Mycobacterium innocens TaxID=2341083 RepID=A0A498Q6B7_9MYCO|nr:MULTISPECIES: DUF732 domain-containing protein [Mycobacterium]KZS55942.1 hypothetical protein A4G26_17475 [Mycobacterium kansasii]KZS72055.1 hypothetical protein A4G29_04275 [Mycobacterium kansasii]VBA41236.1 hypothetical protein LAUMK13_03452 [Mycobacterium innocens]
MGSTGRIRLRLAAVFAAALLGQLGLPLPHASADCVLTAQDQHYIALLARRQIGAASGSTDCDVAALGQQIANDVRMANNPSLRASTIADEVYYGTNLTAEQAAFEVAAAIYVYAPDMVWVVEDTAL